jgi:hypothetical protein
LPKYSHLPRFTHLYPNYSTLAPLYPDYPHLPRSTCLYPKYFALCPPYSPLIKINSKWNISFSPSLFTFAHNISPSPALLPFNQNYPFLL